MAVQVIRFQKQIARDAPGSPFLAWRGDFYPDVTYRGDFVELVAIESGEGRRRVTLPDGSVNVTPIVPGQIHLFRPRDVHAVESLPRRKLAAIGVGFPFVTWERFAVAAEVDRSLFASPDPPTIDFALDDPEALAPFRRLLDLGDSATTLHLVEFLAGMVLRFASAHRMAHGQQAPEWLWAAIDAMHSEANLRIGTARFVELCHVSRAHLWRTTRHHFGMSPSELILDIQLRHAASLLTSTDENVSLIGVRCGLANASHFSKVFRRAHLMSPREYRMRSRAW